MNRRSFVGVAGLALALAWGGAALAQDAAVEKGKKVYENATPKCKICHAIAGVGNAKGNMDGVGSKLKAEEIKAWMRTPKEAAAKAKAERKPPMPAYPPDKLSDEDLTSLTAYLLSLKK
jgi:mono/diheme cytochrome c family protein